MVDVVLPAAEPAAPAPPDVVEPDPVVVEPVVDPDPDPEPVACGGAVAGAARTGVAAAPGAVPGSAATASDPDGGIASSRMLSRARSAKTGPAEVEPVSPGAVSWSITVIETCGLSAGRYPVNVVTR